jgi:hypothetical protein
MIQKIVGPEPELNQISQTTCVMNQSTYFFVTPSGTRSSSTMSKTEVDVVNIIKTIMELSKEQKKEVKDMTYHYREFCIDYLTIVRGGKMVRKVEFYSSLVHGEMHLL